MAILSAPIFFYALAPSSSCSCRRIIRATISAQKNEMSPLSIPKICLVGEELDMRTGYTSTATTSDMEKDYTSTIINLDTSKRHSPNPPAAMLTAAKLYAIMEAVADRVEMHKNVGAQRDNWNHLLLTSINAMTLTAATMAGLAATNVNGATPCSLVALKASSTILYLAATGVLVVMNKTQPSQLAEEQCNAVRLFKQLHGEIQTTMSLRDPTIIDVSDAMEKVLALDRA
jgi:hypothetical protein